jgi:hypothetical protein
MKERMMFLIAFLGITILTAVIVLSANIGLFGEAVRTSDFSKWGIGAVLAEIVGATVIAFKWSFTTTVVKVNLRFENESSSGVDLDFDKCMFTIRESGNIVSTGKLDLVFGLGEGGWQCTLPSTVTSNQSVQLDFVERNGQVWWVKPFAPFLISQKVTSR